MAGLKILLILVLGQFSVVIAQGFDDQEIANNAGVHQSGLPILSLIGSSLFGHRQQPAPATASTNTEKDKEPATPALVDAKVSGLAGSDATKQKNAPPQNGNAPPPPPPENKLSENALFSDVLAHGKCGGQYLGSIHPDFSEYRKVCQNEPQKCRSVCMFVKLGLIGEKGGINQPNFDQFCGNIFTGMLSNLGKSYHAASSNCLSQHNYFGNIDVEGGCPAFSPVMDCLTDALREVCGLLALNPYGIPQRTPKKSLDFQEKKEHNKPDGTDSQSRNPPQGNNPSPNTPPSNQQPTPPQNQPPRQQPPQNPPPSQQPPANQQPIQNPPANQLPIQNPTSSQQPPQNPPPIQQPSQNPLITQQSPQYPRLSLQPPQNPPMNKQSTQNLRTGQWLPQNPPLNQQPPQNSLSGQQPVPSLPVGQQRLQNPSSGQQQPMPQSQNPQQGYQPPQNVPQGYQQPTTAQTLSQGYQPPIPKQQLPFQPQNPTRGYQPPVQDVQPPQTLPAQNPQPPSSPTAYNPVMTPDSPPPAPGNQQQQAPNNTYQATSQATQDYQSPSLPVQQGYQPPGTYGQQPGGIQISQLSANQQLSGPGFQGPSQGYNIPGPRFSQDNFGMDPGMGYVPNQGLPQGPGYNAFQNYGK